MNQNSKQMWHWVMERVDTKIGFPRDIGELEHIEGAQLGSLVLRNVTQGRSLVKRSSQVMVNQLLSLENHFLVLVHHSHIFVVWTV